jgi:hypothetical protein
MRRGAAWFPPNQATASGSSPHSKEKASQRCRPRRSVLCRAHPVAASITDAAKRIMQVAAACVRREKKVVDFGVVYSAASPARSSMFGIVRPARRIRSVAFMEIMRLAITRAAIW